MSKTEFVLRLSPEKASIVFAALDLYERVGRGELEAVTELTETGFVPCRGIDGDPVPVVPQHSYFVSRMVHGIKGLLGLAPDGTFGRHPKLHRNVEAARQLREEILMGGEQEAEPLRAAA